MVSAVNSTYWPIEMTLPPYTHNQTTSVTVYCNINHPKFIAPNTNSYTFSITKFRYPCINASKDPNNPNFESVISRPWNLDQQSHQTTLIESPFVNYTFNITKFFVTYPTGKCCFENATFTLVQDAPGAFKTTVNSTFDRVNNQLDLFFDKKIGYVNAPFKQTMNLTITLLSGHS